MASALLSGAFRISNTGNVFNRVLSTTTTISTWLIQDMVLANGVSDIVISNTLLSSPNTNIVFGGASLCRINYSGHASYVSSGSAGWQFKDFWAHIGSGMSVITGVHFANSSGDSCTVTLILGA